MRKKSISLLLVFILLCSIVSAYIVPIQAAGMTLQQLQTKYPAGSRWTDSFDGSSECAGFARLMCYEVYGGDGYIGSAGFVRTTSHFCVEIRKGAVLL